MEDLSPSTHNMDVPNVTRREYSLINIEDGFLSLMLDDGSTKEDVKLPDNETGEQIQEGFEEGKELLVTVVSAMGEEHALTCKYFFYSFYIYFICHRYWLRTTKKGYITNLFGLSFFVL